MHFESKNAQVQPGNKLAFARLRYKQVSFLGIANHIAMADTVNFIAP